MRALAVDDAVGRAEGIGNVRVGAIVIKKVTVFALFTHVAKLVSTCFSNFLYQFPLAVFEALKRHGLPVVKVGK